MGVATSGPNEVLVVSGCCRSPPTIKINGGRAVYCECVHRVQRLNLNIMTINVETHKVYTKLGVAVSVSGVAQVKIPSNNKDMMNTAITQFLGKNQRNIITIAKETLEGHQRAMLGTLTVEEIFQDRHKFSQAVFEVASTDFVNLGLTIVSYVLTDIRDEHGYLRALGQARTAQVHRDAAVGEAECARDAGVKAAKAEQIRTKADLENRTIIAQAERDFLLKKATYDQEVNAKKAVSELSYSLQQAKTRQNIKEETMEVAVVERRRAIDVQEQEISRKEKQLEAEMKKPAEAERFKVEKLAEAHKQRTVLEATAEAEAVKLQGEAQAYAIEAKAHAEAEQMARKADAWKEYQDAAMVDMVLDNLPRVVAEVAAPVCETKRIVMVSGEGGEVGIHKMTREILDVVTDLPDTVQKMTGVDVSKALVASRA
eukprot:scpid58083/ scgid18197/ Flotillin-1